MKETIRLHFRKLVTGILGFLLLSMLPIIPWTGIKNPVDFYHSIKVKAEVANYLALKQTLFSLLDFIKQTKFGAIGLFAMILMMLAVTSLYFIIKAIYVLYIKKDLGRRNVWMYMPLQVAAFFSFATAIATVAFTFFANAKSGVTAFYANWVVYLVLIAAAILFVVAKTMGDEVRKELRLTGFFHELRKNWVLFAMLIPTFVYFMINNYLPMIGVYYAFTSFNFRDGLWASPYIGLKNFEYLMVSDLFKLTKNTILYNLVFIGIGNVLQIFFAILVSQLTKKWFKKLSQTFMLMPYFVSFVILKVLVYNLFEYDHGIVNGLIMNMGGDRIDFYNSPKYWPYLITLFYMWKNIGYGMVVYLAAITGISPEFYEAAKVDGANLIQQIRHITLPLLKPTFIILLLFALGSIMKGQFELFYQIIGNNGVLYNATDIFDTYVYRITTTQPLSIGIGTAAGLYQSLFGFVIIMVTNFLVKRKNPDYALF